MVRAGWPFSVRNATSFSASSATVSSAILSMRSGIPSAIPRFLNSSAKDSLRFLVIQTMRLTPPSAERNLLLVRKKRPIPMKPGVCAPPPTVPARVENFIPMGVMPVKPRFTIITPFASGTMAMMHSKQPQEVIGASMMLYALKYSRAWCEFVYTNSHQALEYFNAYSIMDAPMTSCGCFECIMAIVPEANGVMIVNRGFTGMTPIGMKFSTLAGTVGGGAQTPGFMGIGRFFLTSKKFLSAEGGFKRVVWMTKNLKESFAEEFKKRAQEEGIPDLIDRIADETVAEDSDKLLAYLTEKGHPALTMDPMF